VVEVDFVNLGKVGRANEACYLSQHEIGSWVRQHQLLGKHAHRHDRAMIDRYTSAMAHVWDTYGIVHVLRSVVD
jgi:hypothetical protein